MILENLRKINPSYYKDYERVILFFFDRKGETNVEKVEAFRQEWLSCTASISDWINIGPVDIDALNTSAGLSKNATQKIKKHQKHLYELWLEMYLQLRFLPSFKEIYDVTPRYAIEYAQTQLSQINGLLSGVDIPKNKIAIEVLESRLNLDCQELCQLYAAGSYKREYNIYSVSKSNVLDLVLRYKAFLEAFIADPTIEEAICPEDFDEFSLQNLYPKTIKALSKLYVEYSVSTSYFKDEAFGTYKIKRVNGCFGRPSFQQQLKNIYRGEYKNMLHALRAVDRSEWGRYLNSIIVDLEELRDKIISTDEYKEEEGEYQEERFYTFKKIYHTGFIGEEDARLFFDGFPTTTYHRLLKETAPYADTVDEAINGLIRKIEDTENNLDVVEFAMEVAAENSTSPLSFTYKPSSKGDCLTDFYNGLKDAGYIEKNTTIGTFRNVFYGKKVFQKIIWSKKQAELYHLITKIHSQGKVESKGRKLWETVCNCFEGPGGLQFKRAALKGEKSPKNTNVLDEIINLL